MKKFFFFVICFLPIVTHGKNIVAAKPYVTGVTPTIVLDAGHGAGNLGAHIKSPYVVEKKLTLQTTLMTKKYLEQLGYKVVLTRSKDVFVPLTKRVEIANRTDAEVFVSIHFNSCHVSSICGMEIFYSDSTYHGKVAASKKLGQNILTQILANTHANSRGVKRSNFYVVRETKMPAVLVEGGFMTNTQELTLLRSPQYLDRIAKGIAEGVDKFMRVQKRNFTLF
jgi:N-acetylmuramoyl-L-alanine amidase